MPKGKWGPREKIETTCSIECTIDYKASYLKSSIILPPVPNDPDIPTKSSKV